MTTHCVEGGLRGLVRRAALRLVVVGRLMLVLGGALLLLVLLLLDGVVVGFDAAGSGRMAGVLLGVGGARRVALLLLLLLLSGGGGGGGGCLVLAQRPSARLDMPNGAKVPQVIADGRRPVDESRESVPRLPCSAQTNKNPLISPIPLLILPAPVPLPTLLFPPLQPLNQLDQIARLLGRLDEAMLEQVLGRRSHQRVAL